MSSIALSFSGSDFLGIDVNIVYITNLCFLKNRCFALSGGLKDDQSCRLANYQQKTRVCRQDGGRLMKKRTPIVWDIRSAAFSAVMVLLLAVGTTPAMADLKEMSDTELADITGHGFSQFTHSGDILRADFAVMASTYTEIASLKMGYWDNGTGQGWDQNWTGVQLGSAAQDIVLRGFYIEAAFDNLSDPANRQLKSLFIGFNHVSGDLKARFESLSQIAANGGADNARADLGDRTFRFNDTELRFSLELEGDHKGIWVRFGEGTTLQ